MKKKSNAPSTQERLSWLLAFLQRDLASIRDGERLDLKTDIMRMLLDPAVIIPTAPDGYAVALARLTRKTIPKSAAPTLTDDALVTLQTALRGGVRILDAGLRWVLPVERPPVFAFEPRDDRTIVRRYVVRDLPTALLLSAADLVVAAWPTLRVCAYAPCRVLFQPREGRQHYHDPKCSALARWHRFAPKRNHQEEKERRVLGTGPGRGKTKEKTS